MPASAGFFLFRIPGFFLLTLPVPSSMLSLAMRTEHSIGNSIDNYMSCCTLCPRDCKADRLHGRTGACGVPAEIYVARAALHFWEEPCISGSRGSGAVFFTGCGLKCVFCQNAPISGTETGMERLLGRKVTQEHLAEIFLKLQDDEEANNINLVTAVQYIPQVAEALREAKDRGLKIPVVYNSSGYEKVESLKLLEGLVDVWLPDFKYMDPELGGSYSHAPDYPEKAKVAVAEMVRQAGEPEFYDEQPFMRPPEPEDLRMGGNASSRKKAAGETASHYRAGQRLMKKGVIVRHLLLPGHVKNAKEVVKYLHDTYGNSIYISMMNQYTPMEAMAKDSLLSRKVTRREYERLIDYAVEIGVGNGFLQEGGTAKESFIPSWNGEGV